MESLLSMDIECFSDVDLIKCGVYAYADSPAFEILLFAYSFDGGETQIIDLAQGEKLPAEVEDAIFDVCNAALCSRRKKHFIFDSINTITAPSFR